MKRYLGIKIDEDIANKLDRLAKAENRNRSNMIETLILKALQDRVSVLEQQKEA